MAHKKAGGSVTSGRKANAKRRGVKLFGGEVVKPGNIIVRQKGTKWEPGKGVALGTDYTIYAIQAGRVSFTKKKVIKFNGQHALKTHVNVVA